MATPRLTPSERDGALARLRAWRTAIAVAGVVGVATAATAETIPGRADSSATGAAQAPSGGSTQDPGQQQQVQGRDGFQQPTGGLGRGFGGGRR